MPTFTLFTLSLFAAPVATDREVAPVEIGAPAESAGSSAESAESSPQPQPKPTPAPANDPTEFWVAPPGVPAAAKAPAADLPPPPAPTPKPPDRPIHWRVDIMASLGTSVLRDLAWRAFDNNRSTLQGGVTVRADSRLGNSRLFLGGGAMVRAFSAKGNPHGLFDTTLRVREPVGFARLSAVTVEGVDVFVQAGGGVSIIDLTWQSAASTSQRSIVGMADGLAGVALYLPKRWLARRGASRVTGGLELGAGYTWRGDVNVRPQVDTEPDPIMTGSSSLGDLSLRGFAWRLGLFVRFQ